MGFKVHSIQRRIQPLNPQIVFNVNAIQRRIQPQIVYKSNSIQRQIQPKIGFSTSKRTNRI